MKTPVLFTIFRRRETALKVFAEIRKARPERLYLAADGPRPDCDGEAELCRALRAEIVAGVDWPCRVETLFREGNIGCGRAMSGAVSWFFEHEQEGIILEDDCKPEPGFFSFCEAALLQYRNDEHVMCINGTHAVKECDFSPYCCGFSRYAQIWGWASWRRAWKHYDFEVAGVSLERLELGVQNPGQARRWLEILTAVQEHRSGFDTWDFQWSAALLLNGAVAVVPNRNLIVNIGFSDATHDMPVLPQTSEEEGSGTMVEKFPEKIIPDECYDRRIFELFYRKPGLFRRAAQWLQRKFH